MLDKSRFKKHGDNNIYLSPNISLDISIFKYISLPNLLLLLSNQFYISTKKNFSDRLEIGTCFLLFLSDFHIAGDTISEEMMLKSERLREQVRGSGDWLTSCWTLKSAEDYLMWKVYSSDNYCVRVETTVGRLLASLDFPDYEVFVSKMCYEREKYIIKDLTDYAYYKFNYYKGEEELRFYFFPLNGDKREGNGTYFDVKEPLSLIKGITLSPFFPAMTNRKLIEYIKRVHGVNDDIIKFSRI